MNPTTKASKGQNIRLTTSTPTTLVKCTFHPHCASDLLCQAASPTGGPHCHAKSPTHHTPAMDATVWRPG